MARLNEVPPPAEAIDALKRRFIRQNRELAKNNSNQSIRIRGLENEQARLLAENLSLREQIIQLQTELENSNGRHAFKQINTVKDRLEAKIQEIGGLVAELNSIERPPRETRSSTSGPSRSTEHFEWKRAMKEQAEEQEDVLPTIREDKYFPRRTLDAEELRVVLANTSEDSPDLGPPPVAHFQDEDPIKFDPKPTAEDGEMEIDREEENELPATVSVNLETRKKRRDGSTKLDLRKMSVFQSPQEDNTNKKSRSEVSQTLRAGTKRKLSATAEDLQAEAGDNDPREEFRFSRRAGADADKGATENQPLDPSIKQNSKLDFLIAAERKALGDKTNTSPKKIQKYSVAESKPDAKKSSISSRDTSRSRAKDRKTKAPLVKIAPAETNEVIETAEVPVEQAELPPKTPAGLDIFSPASTEPSTTRQESRDTPPPGDLNTPGTSEAPAGGRAARRARAPVNYAEPNLISKMRRPTKDMMNAVVDNSRSSSVQLEDMKSAPTSSNPMRTVVIKKERTDDGGSAWRSVPSSAKPEAHSPLSNKTGAAQQAPELEKQGAEAGEPETVDDEPSKSATAMKDLMSTSTAGSRRRTKAQASTEATVAREEDKEDRPDLAIFDFIDSSPADRESDAIMKSSRDLVSRASRRHSSISSMAKESSAAGATKNSDEGRGRAIKDLKQSKSSTMLTATAARTERNASRRRSMML